MRRATPHRRSFQFGSRAGRGLLVALALSVYSGGCIDITLDRVGPDPMARCKSLHPGMPRQQVRELLGAPEHTEAAKNWLGFKTNHENDVYDFYVEYKHFYVQFIVIACGAKGPGVILNDDEYKMIVEYDPAQRVVRCETVPAFQHGRD